jgi:hypothetical protein
MKLNNLVLRYLKPTDGITCFRDSSPLAGAPFLASPLCDFHSATRDWPSDWRDLFEERAAIMEYDANLERAEAERSAFEDIRRLFH